MTSTVLSMLCSDFPFSLALLFFSFGVFTYSGSVFLGCCALWDYLVLEEGGKVRAGRVGGRETEIM